MAFTGNEAEIIPLDTASAWTKNYRNTMKSGEAQAHFFGMNLIKQILAQTGVVGFRIYYGIDDTGKKQLIIVGTDANENDLYNGIIVERSVWCPPSCGNANPLNS